MRQLIIFILLTIITLSCVDKFDSGIEPNKPESIVENEYLNSYDVLKAYFDTTSNQIFKIGAYIGVDAFLEKSNMYSLIASNFNEIAANKVFSHGAVVKDNGSMDFSTVEKFIQEAKASDLDIFGYSLCSHSNQNATFLNGRYALKEFETPSFPNLLNKPGLEDGTFTGWSKHTMNGGSIEKAEYNGDAVVKLISGSSSANPDDLRLSSPNIPVSKSTYELTMFILSDKEGEGRFTFEGLNNNTPQLDWTGSGAKSATFKTNPGWNKISIQLNDFANENIKFHLDLGYTPNVTYYVHISGLSIVDINGQFYNPDEIFLEAEECTVGSKWTIEDDANASGGKYAVVTDKYVNLTTPGDDPSNNISHTFTINTPGNYKFWVRGKGASANDDSFNFKVDDNDWYTWNNVLKPDYLWHVIGTFYFDMGEHKITVSYRENGAKLDRLYFTLSDKTPTNFGSPVAKSSKIYLDLEAAEKVTAIGGTLDNWISSLVSKVKNDVNAWVVVNEPMDNANPYEIKTSNGTISENEFYWQDYLGKDYAVMAFKSARTNVKQGDLLFISDYGLNSNLEKCRGLIAYIKYIEEQGATVDGIAVQLQLSLESDVNDISTMFKLLAATGKLVKVAQLEVSIPSGSEITDTILQQQANMYKSVVSSFFENVPAAKRYGIEVLGLKDSDDNLNGLWNTSYNRKPSYAGFADGLKNNQ